MTSYNKNDLAIHDMQRTMALTFYSADVINNFKKFDDNIIKKLTEELQELTLRLPIYYRPEEFKKNSFKKVLENMGSKFLSAYPNNEIKININKVIKEKVTPLYLMALFTYCVDRLSGGQIAERSEYLKMGKLLSKDDKEKE